MVIVAYKLKRGRKVRVGKFDTTVDDILNTRKRKPHIPHDAELLDIGVGESFYEKYCKKYRKYL